MRKSSRIALKAFLEKVSPEKRKELTHFLSEKSRFALADTVTIAEENPFEDEKLVDVVHWSWFLPTLKTYSEGEQKLFLSTLKAASSRNLAKTLDLLKGETELAEPVKEYFRNMLLDSLIDRKDPPLKTECLPDSPLNKLLKLSKKELVRLIDFLALHDLADELRQIVETKILKKIYSLLSEEEKKVLKKAAAHKDPFSMGKLNLERWDGSDESFRTLLHRRGLMRFAAALSGQDPDFLWHICHQLDIGRGSTLYKLSRQEAPQIARETILRQIEELL